VPFALAQQDGVVLVAYRHQVDLGMTAPCVADVDRLKGEISAVASHCHGPTRQFLETRTADLAAEPGPDDIDEPLRALLLNQLRIPVYELKVETEEEVPFRSD
jgi:hypothetical protein